MDEIDELANELFYMSHDKQFLILKKLETKFLKDILNYRVVGRQEYAIENVKNGDNMFLNVLIESTYVWATITTIMRSRGEYGDLNED